MKESEVLMNYKSISLSNSLNISDLYTVHYFEYTNDFSFEGESHDFWEFIYVDKGEVDIMMDTTPITLQKGEIAFHKPNEFHKVDATGHSAPNLVVISFKCDSPEMDFFQNKVLKIDELERNLLADIILEARHVFSTRLDDPYLTQMIKRQTIPFGSEQLIQIYLEHFLIHLMRKFTTPIVVTKYQAGTPPKSTKSKNDTEIFNRIVHYMETHLNSHITIEQLCKDNMIGRSQLQGIFQSKAQLGIIEYFSKMKIDAAKHMIRTGRLNFTQIAEQLGYTSIHYFSRQFKKITDMTPSEYASSVKARSERTDEETKEVEKEN